MPHEGANKGHVNIRTGQQSDGKRQPDESRFLLDHVDDQLRCLSGEKLASGCTMSRSQAGGGTVMFWAVSCHPCGY